MVLQTLAFLVGLESGLCRSLAPSYFHEKLKNLTDSNVSQKTALPEEEVRLENKTQSSKQQTTETTL